MRSDIKQLERRPTPTPRPATLAWPPRAYQHLGPVPRLTWPPDGYADVYARPRRQFDAATQTRLAYEIHALCVASEEVVLLTRGPLPPMPTVPTSGYCVTPWFDGLPWREGDKSHDGKPAPALLCTKPAGHKGTHEAQGSKRQVVAKHVEPSNGLAVVEPPGGDT